MSLRIFPVLFCICIVAITEDMAGPEIPCIKQDFMVKRSIMRSWLIKKENYKSRWFLLTARSLLYCDGNMQAGFL